MHFPSREFGLSIVVVVFLVVGFANGASSPPIDAIVAKIDEDKDGQINIHEFSLLYSLVFGGESDSHDHDHHHKRELKLLLTGGKRQENHEEEECPPASELFNEYDADENSLLNQDELREVLVEMSLLVVNECVIHIEEKTENCESGSTTVAWICTISATVLVSLLALGGVAVLPLDRKKDDEESLANVLMPIFLAFAVGALVGDSVLHLIPVAVGAHSHDQEEGEESEKAFLGPACMVLLGIIIFFLMERQIDHFHEHIHSVKSHGHSHSHSHKSTKEVEMAESGKENDEEDEPHTIKPVGYLSLFADGMHNFVDGLALAAAFLGSLSSGVATTIAVTLHEIPQELADFAILVNAGFSKPRAIFWNFISGLTCILGGILGLAIGEVDERSNRYLLGLVAGGFLYISLADMVHEMMHKKGGKQTIIQGTSILSGFVLMLIISLWLEDIDICL